MNYQNFFENLADIIDTGMTHALSFELRKLKNEDRARITQHLRNIARDSKKQLNNQ